MKKQKITIAELKKIILSSGRDKPSKDYPYWLNDQIIKSAERCVQTLINDEDPHHFVTEKQKVSLKNWIDNMRETYLL